MARTGYLPLRDALSWMGAHASRNMSTKIGGVLDPGFHRNCECIEIWDNGDVKDYIFRSPDGEFKQRVYNNKFTYILGAKYNLTIKAGFGDVSIQGGADGKYHLLNKAGTSIWASAKMGDLYKYAKDNHLKIIYNSIISAARV